MAGAKLTAVPLAQETHLGRGCVNQRSENCSQQVQ